MLKVSLIASCLLVPAVVLAENTAYDTTLQGKKCYEHEQVLGCEYKVGKDLEFSIEDIGSPNTGITFLHANNTGDYYAKYGIQHGCIIVTHGKKSSMYMRDFAFVSPRNGKVYKTWELCKQGM